MTVPCVKLPEAKGACSVRFPGGVVIEAMPSLGDGEFERGIALFRAMTPALAGLAPFFTVLQAVLAIVDFCKALATLNPVDIANALAAFTQAVNKLLAIVPAVSIPLLIKDLLTCMISFLAGVLEKLVALQAQIARIAEARAVGIELNLPEIEVLMQCADDNVELYLEHLSASMGVFGSLWGVIQLFADLAGIGALVPDIVFDTTGDLDEVIESLQALVLKLQEILEALP